MVELELLHLKMEVTVSEPCDVIRVIEKLLLLLCCYITEIELEADREVVAVVVVVILLCLLLIVFVTEIKLEADREVFAVAVVVILLC